MSGDDGTRVEKSVSALKKDIKDIQVNPKKLFFSLGKAAINLGFLKFDDFLESGLDVLDSVGLKQTPGEIAGLLIVRSLIRAMKQLVEENQNDIPEKLNELYHQLENSLEDSNLVINGEFFQRPQNLPFLNKAQAGFAQWLGSYLENEVEVKQISSRLPSYFVAALHDEWLEGEEQYVILQKNLNTPFTQAKERERSWQRYNAYLQRRVEEPMFLEAFGLKQVYVPLRAYYEREKKAEEDKEDRFTGGSSERKVYERVVVDVAQELESWLQQGNNQDAIRLVTGGPGSGKSSLGKMLAAQLAATGNIPVLFIPLHLFRVTEDLVQAVGEFVQTEGFFTHNPLERDNNELRLLIIFDGLDELSMQGKVAEEAARQFVDEVRRQVELFNLQKTRLQVIISGRDVVIQANRGKQSQVHQLLHLLPYFLAGPGGKKYVDKEDLLKNDQRQTWWQNYGRAKGTGYKSLPQELEGENLAEITGQPLLNYLIALSYERGQLKFTKDTNLNEIYDDLLESVYERGYEGTNRQHRAIEEISQIEFVGILEEIALACWHGDGRTTTVKEIEEHCCNSGLKQVLERFQQRFREDPRASITRLLTAFYFRESRERRKHDKTFEFTHKSFGEYLTAKRIVKGLQRIHKELEERKVDFYKDFDEKQALVIWAKLCGPTAIDEYLWQFILDEIKLQDKKLVRQWQLTLCSLIEFMLAQGMPMESVTTIKPNFQEYMRQARNAEEALLVVLNVCARVTKKVSKISWPTNDAFGAWISRLQGQRINVENVLAFECLSLLDLQKCILFLRDLFGANLEGANLEGADLEGADLVSARLEGANLEGANLVSANLVSARLEGANLVRANLQDADLVSANLEGARLEGANIGGANIDGANLKNTVLGSNKGISEEVIQDLIARGAIWKPQTENDSKF